MKDILHTSKNCGGKYEIEYDSNYIPSLKCSACNHIVNDWLKWEENYSKLYLDEDSWKEQKNYPVCIIGYALSKYKESYSINYKMSLSEKGFFRGPEVLFANKILKHFDKDIVKIKEYIDWFFKKELVDRKKKMTNLSWLIKTESLNKFNFYFKAQQIITRNTKIPPVINNWLSENGKDLLDQISLDDFGDIDLFLKSYKSGQLRTDIAKNFIYCLIKNQYVNHSLEIQNWSSNG